MLVFLRDYGALLLIAEDRIALESICQHALIENKDPIYRKKRTHSSFSDGTEKGQLAQSTTQAREGDGWISKNAVSA